jgi:hypothetical protein
VFLKRHLILTILCVIWQTGFCQHKYTDSLINIIKTTKSDSKKVEAMYSLSYEYQTYKPDSALLVAQQLYDFSKDIKYLPGESLALDGLGGAFFRIGDNAQALEYYLKRLNIEEKRDRPDNIAIIYMNVANVYNRNNEQEKASLYILKADSIINEHRYHDLKLYAYLNTGNILEKANKLSEALYYTINCYQLALAANDSLMIGSALNNLGNIYRKKLEYHTAIDYYFKSQPYINAANDNQTLSEGIIGLSKAYHEIGLADSALFFARLAYEISNKNSLLTNALNSSNLLSELFSDFKKYDSAFLYQATSTRLKDSIQGNEKIKLLESLSIQEQLREQRMAALKEKEKEENRQRLQLLSIGIFIPVFFLFSIFMSRRKIHKKVIEFLGILSLLLFFEYLTLVIHPFVAELTHHTPFLEILIFVALAALLVPGHHKIEHWFTKHLAINYERARTKKRRIDELKQQHEDIVDNVSNTEQKSPSETVQALPTVSVNIENGNALQEMDKQNQEEEVDLPPDSSSNLTRKSDSE